jgi:hypothetical protein
LIDPAQNAKDINDIHQEMGKYDDVSLEKEMEKFFGFLLTASTCL